MARILPTNVETMLPHCRVRTCITIILANASVIRVADAGLTVGGNTFLPLLSSISPLRMGLTKSADQISGQISNISLAFGQTLIAEDGALDNNYTEIGVCFEDLETGEKYYDEKISGEIIKSQIDDENFSFKFESDLDAAEFYGKAVVTEFPDVVVVSPNLPPRASDDFSDLINVYNPNEGSIIARKLAGLTDDWNYGRFYLPEALY